jgi:hypothetical protein
MHDDLIDTVGYVAGESWADPARVAITGGSYGGYAALVGAAFHPGGVLLRRGPVRPVQPEDAFFEGFVMFSGLELENLRASSRRGRTGTRRR